MSKSKSSRKLWVFGVLLGLAVIAAIVVAFFVDGLTIQSITVSFVTLGIIIIALIATIIFYRLLKARPELVYTGPDGKTRFRGPDDRSVSDEKKTKSPYDSVRSDSYQYKSRGYGKKPFTDFCLEETTTCSICKLKIDKNEKIYRCPECRSPFHIEHLADWLNENSDCPICNVELTL